MQLIDAFTSAWSRSFDYKGRSNRADFSWYMLALLIVLAVLGVLSVRLQTIFALASIVPSLPLQVRRLRDSGKAWPWIFISLVPLVGSIWLIVLFCQPSIPG